MRIVSFASGSGGNCTLLSGGGAHILLDAGISLRRIRQGLNAQGLKPADISALFITHAHNDHIGGLRVLSKQCALPVYATGETAALLGREVPESIPYLHVLQPGEPVELPGGLAVTAFPTLHDIPGSVGYRVCRGEERFGLCTDLGCVTDEVYDELCGVEAAILEANHDVELLRRGPYPYPLKRRILSDRGHLSNESCGALARELACRGLRQLLLGHLSRENNSPRLALDTVRAMTPESLELGAAPPDSPAAMEWGTALCWE